MRLADALIGATAIEHGLTLITLIGATAIEHGLTLITANVRHVGTIGGLSIEAFSPRTPPRLKPCRFGCRTAETDQAFLRGVARTPDASIDLPLEGP
jgi:Flp pilus assembly pilin Flp